MSRRRVVLAIRVAATLAIVGWLLWKVDLAQLGDHLAGAKLLPLALAIVVMNVDRVLMAYKWWLLLRARGMQLDLRHVVRLYYAATFGNLVLPTVGGDAYRVVVASRETGATDDIVASVLVERVLGMMATCLVAALGTAVFVATRHESSGVRYALLLVGASMISVVLVGVANTSAFASLGQRLADSRHTVVHKAGDIMSAYGRYADNKRTLRVFMMWSVVEHAPAILSAFWVSRALCLDIPFQHFLLFVPIIESSIKLPIPASFAGFGLAEGLYVYLFGTVGVEASAALSMGFVTHAIFWVAILPVYLVLWAKRGRESALGARDPLTR